MDSETKTFQSNQLKQNNKNYKIILIVLVLIFIGVFLIYKSFITKGRILQPTLNNQQNLKSNIDNNNQLELFYYTQDDSPLKDTHYKIFKVSLDLQKTDSNTHSFTIPGKSPYVITDSWKENVILFVTNSETQWIIYSLDVSLENSQPSILLTIPFNNKGERVESVKYIDNGNSLAFITSDGEIERRENSILNIVSLKNQQNKESILLNKKGILYTGFGFLTETLDNKIIYIHESGADGGSAWSQWYKVDRENKKLQKLPTVGNYPVKNATDYVFSPDRTKLAYADFSSIIDPVDLDYEQGPECLKYDEKLLQKYSFFGGTVIVQDLITSKSDEIFRNVTYEDNYCKNVGNRIVSIKWLDNSNLAFETIDGVYMINVNTKKSQKIFTFEETGSPGITERPSIELIQLPFIVLSDNSIIQTDTNKRLSLLYSETQEKHFFTLSK